MRYPINLTITGGSVGVYVEAESRAHATVALGDALTNLVSSQRAASASRVGEPCPTHTTSTHGHDGADGCVHCLRARVAELDHELNASIDRENETAAKHMRPHAKPDEDFDAFVGRVVVERDCARLEVEKLKTDLGNARSVETQAVMSLEAERGRWQIAHRHLTPLVPPGSYSDIGLIDAVVVKLEAERAAYEGVKRRAAEDAALWRGHIAAVDQRRLDNDRLIVGKLRSDRDEAAARARTAEEQRDAIGKKLEHAHILVADATRLAEDRLDRCTEMEADTLREFAQARAERDGLRTALEWYAKSDNYGHTFESPRRSALHQHDRACPTCGNREPPKPCYCGPRPVVLDAGHRARQALAETKMGPTRDEAIAEAVRLERGWIAQACDNEASDIRVYTVTGAESCARLAAAIRQRDTDKKPAGQT